MKKIVSFILVLSSLSGCAVGHKSWVEQHDNRIGQKVIFVDPTRFGDAGDIVRSDFLMSGDGFTHITKNKDGDTVQHWFYREVLPTFRGNKEWIGKCKIFVIVDPKTNIIKSWGHDVGGNPKSCRIWG